jgi:hypothetical protein
MKFKRLLSQLAAGVAVACFAMSLSAAMAVKMSLGDLVDNADKVYRGTVLTREPGSVSAGGTELSTVVYTIRVDQALKGDFGSGKDTAVVTMTMLGSLKTDVTQGEVKRLFNLDVNPNLEVGSEYVLFTTAPSGVGLSTTVGLDQGLFRIFTNADGRELTANGLNNHGIFDGPVQYGELAAAVAALLNQ